MSNFWDEVNEELYWNGCKSIVEKLNEQYPNITDEEYEKLHKELATQALKGDFSTVTKEEGYYLICEEYTPLLTQRAVSF